MTDDDQHRETYVRDRSRPNPTLIDTISARTTATLFWILTAATYGYIAGRYPDTQQLPDIAVVTLLFGFALAGAFAASVVHWDGGGDD